MKRISVFCGASIGGQEEYAKVAADFGSLLASEGIGLVFGGGKVGLMGVIADAVMESGGEVIGVIPEHLMTKEVAHQGLKDLRVVKSMHERKALMAELSDGFAAMPGGFGTFEEFCEIVTWAQLGLHKKPTGLLNVRGYYNPLIELFDRGVKEKFIQPAYRELVLCANEPKALLHLFKSYRAPSLPRWVQSPSET